MPSRHCKRRTHLGGVEIPKDSCLNENNASVNVEIYHENPTLPAKLKTLTKMGNKKNGTRNVQASQTILARFARKSVIWTSFISQYVRVHYHKATNDKRSQVASSTFWIPRVQETNDEFCCELFIHGLLYSTSKQFQWHWTTLCNFQKTSSQQSNTSLVHLLLTSANLPLDVFNTKQSRTSRVSKYISNIAATQKRHLKTTNPKIAVLQRVRYPTLMIWSCSLHHISRQDKHPKRIINQDDHCFEKSR